MVVGGLGEARAQAQLPKAVLQPHEVHFVEHGGFEAVGRSHARRVRSDCHGGFGPGCNYDDGEEDGANQGSWRIVGIHFSNIANPLQLRSSSCHHLLFRCASQSSTNTWSAPAMGIAPSAPSTPASDAPISTAMSTISGESWTVRP